MATLLKVLNNLADIKSAGGCCTSRQNSGTRYIRLQLSTIFSYPLPAAFGFDQDWNSESSKKLAEPYIRSASKAAPKSLFQGRRSFHDDRTNLLWRPAKAAPRVLTVTADLGHERV